MSTTETRLSFLGAAGNVTGSSYLLESGGRRVLIDCGLYQERQFKRRNWDPFPVAPDTIDCVLLTHSHLDHCGLLPKLVREGFSGSIYCTPAAAEIAKIVILDAARIQEEDAEFKKRRHQREGRKGRYPEVPPYYVADAEATLPLFSTVQYGESLKLCDGIVAVFRDAGHILGAAMIEIDLEIDGKTRTILFSGDVGRKDKPILEDPSLFDRADYVVIESTYGDRTHQEQEDIPERLATIINETHLAGGNIVIPAFAIERSQEILYYLNELLMEDRIPHMMVFLDSPMAIRVTDVFKNHPDIFDREMTLLMKGGNSPFEFPGLVMTMTVEQSKSINHIRGTSIIIAGSGMCAGGRIKHHLVANISRQESTILFVGFQAKGTLGREIVEGAREVRILGRMHRVNARITQIEGLSAHADREELLEWITSLIKAPRRVFVTHGEAENAASFAGFLTEKTGWNVSVPEYGEEYILD
ncbi:MAG: MBL fold metallo-hydrolase [Dehalococcoidia bacterium]